MNPRQFFLRLAISLIIGVGIGVLINEVSFNFMKSEAGRPAQRIELVIPNGTADKLARGEGQEAIPLNMVFVTGDTLVVRNEDSQTHTLGPLLIPAGASASLNLDQAENLAMSCSFQPSQYMGLDVREPVNIDTRLFGIFLSGVPLGIMFLLYSFVIWPVKNQPQAGLA